MFFSVSTRVRVCEGCMRAESLFKLWFFVAHVFLRVGGMHAVSRMLYESCYLGTCACVWNVCAQ